MIYRLPRPALRRRTLLKSMLGWPLAGLGGLTGGLTAVPVQAQRLELTSLAVQRVDAELLLDFSVRLVLPRAVEDALRRGVPLYFAAEATLRRPRWYWRDQRVARVRRSWRLAYQPLTSAWRVSLGALTQTFATLDEALSAMSAAGRWRVADVAELAPGVDHVLGFRYELDNSQLPSPLQIGFGGQPEWELVVEREIDVPAAEAAR